MSRNIFLDLPDDLLYSILSYTVGLTGRAHILCHKITLLCSSIRHSIEFERQELWFMILNEYKNTKETPKNSRYTKTETKPSRSSKRLRRNTAKEEVADCHKLLCDRTYIAFYALTEMANSSRTPLSLRNLRWIFKNYGPILRCNQYQNPDQAGASASGTFLVECCRARHVKESIILSCIKELIEKHGALPDVNIQTEGSEANVKPCRSFSTPLCIASARGMPSVVKYLIFAGASISHKGTDCIPLLTNPHKRIRGTHTPLEFAKEMHLICYPNDAELRGSKEYKALKKCINILEQEERTKNERTI